MGQIPFLMQTSRNTGPMGFTVAASTSTREGEGASLPFLSALMPVLFFCDLSQKDAQHRKKMEKGN